MNNAASQSNEFASLLQRFFIERLMQQQNASPRTVESYRDTFRLLLKFAQQRLNRPPEKLTFVEFNSALITDFLDHLETIRHNSIRSRNARLAAVHAFCHFVAMQYPPALYVVQQILSIPSKRFEKPLLGFLTREEVQALLVAPNPVTWFGQRDRAMLTLMYNTGARVSELTGILVADVTLTSVQWVRLRGKGRKQRTVPLWDETGSVIRAWISGQGLKPEQPLLPNRYGRPMTRANVAERFGLAVAIAGKTCPQLLTRHVSPHSMRHAVAMHLLQSGTDISVIAIWLGHESPMTTHGYVEADDAMKERALAAIQPPDVTTTRYHPSDALLKFLEEL